VNKNIKNLIFLSIALLVLNFIFVQTAYAATNLEVIVPEEEVNIGDEIVLSLHVNALEEEINGIDFVVTYDEGVSYVSSGAEEESICTPTFSDTDSEVRVVCFVEPGNTFTGEGSLGFITFKAEEAGIYTFSPKTVEVAGGTVGSVEIASVTVESDELGSEAELLPLSEFVEDNKPLVIASGVVLFGAVLASLVMVSKGKGSKQEQDSKVE